MSNLNYIAEKLQNNETAYLLNDFEEIAIKLVPGGKEGYKVFAKPKGKKSFEEYEINRTSNLALETRIAGKQITKEEYELYGLENEKEIEIVPPSVKEDKMTSEELTKAAIDLIFRRRKPKNKQEEELFKQIIEIEKKGGIIDLPFE